METAIETFKVNGYSVKIYQDTDPVNPHKDFQTGTLVFFSHNYSGIGDRQAEDVEIEAMRRGGLPLLTRFLRVTEEAAIVLPVSMLDHSGLHIWIGNGPHWSDSAGWDSGLAGFLYLTERELASDWFDGDKESATNYLKASIEEIDQWLRGDVYGYVIENPAGDHVDSCWGFYGFDYCKQEARTTARALPRLTKTTLHLRRNLAVTVYPTAAAV